jgi:uncharacterized protein (TIGR03435 family)
VSDGDKQMGFGKTVGRLLQNAYQIREPRIVFPEKPPEDKYDYIVSLPDHQLQALQATIKKKFGLVGKKATRDVDVLLLRVANPNAPRFRPTSSSNQPNQNNAAAGRIRIVNEPLSNVTFSLELYLRKPVIDETGLTWRYDADLVWDANEQDFNPEGLKKAALEQLGLEFVPDHRPIEMLFVEKSR